MQDRHDRDHPTESVMLGAAIQTSWVMENRHDKSYILSDVFAFDIAEDPTTLLPKAISTANTSRCGRAELVMLHLDSKKICIA